MTTKPRRTPTAARQAARLTTALDALTSLRAALLAHDCPPTVPDGERTASVADLGRAVMQLENLQRWYGKGGKR